jgi:uncharacterized membrane protein (DUF4010 family)
LSAKSKVTGSADTLPWLGLAVAGAAGLLIGLERERRRAQPGYTAFAGVRTFSVAALAGAIAQSLGEPWLVLIGAVFVAVLISIAYLRSSRTDAGITTEIALFVTYLIGVSAIEHPGLAAGVSVAVTILLAARSRLHQFASELLSGQELRDALLLAASALIVLPLAPSTPIGALGGIDLRQIWSVVVLLLAIQAAGHIGLRILGTRHGLPLSGLASGFVTSTGTIAALGLRAKHEPALLRSCVAGALLSCASTFVQLALVIATVNAPVVGASLPVLAGGLCGVLLVALPWLRTSDTEPQLPAQDQRAFSLHKTIAFALLLTAVTVITGWIERSLGTGAAMIAVATAGFADVHAACASALSMAATAAIGSEMLQPMMLVAISTNTLSKVVASFAGGPAYALRVAPGLLVIAGSAWLTWAAFG